MSHDPDPVPEVDVSIAELMTVCLARYVTRYETVLQGFASPMPTAALRLARAWNPELTHLSAAGGLNPAPASLPVSTEDHRLTEGAVAYFPSPAAFDLAARGELDAIFLGSPQIDRAGNMNGSVIGDFERPTVRFGGGGGGGSLLSLVEAGIGWRTEHTPRAFPAEVDFVTAAGNLAVVVTPLCVFAMMNGELQVTQLHPGVSRAEIQEATGWAVTFADPARTERPTVDELARLEAVDPTRVRRAGFEAAQLSPLAGTDSEA